MADGLLRLTPTRVATYQDCPRRYRFRYVDRAAGDPTPRAHLTLGSAVHLALARWWDLPAPVAAWASEADVERLLADAWSTAGFRDDAQSERWRRVATRWLHDYLRERMPAERPVGIERTVAYVRGDVAWEGRVDRIDADRRGLVVVDYKLGREPPTVDDAAASLALAVYAYGSWKVLRAPCVRVELHHVPTGTVAKAHRDAEWLRRLVGRLDVFGAEIRARQLAAAEGGPADRLFPTTPGPLCGSCEFRAACPDGASRPADEPWAALERWDVPEPYDRL